MPSACPLGQFPGTSVVSRTTSPCSTDAYLNPCFVSAAAYRKQGIDRPIIMAMLKCSAKTDNSVSWLGWHAIAIELISEVALSDAWSGRGLVFNLFDYDSDQIAEWIFHIVEIADLTWCCYNAEPGLRARFWRYDDIVPLAIPANAVRIDMAHDHLILQHAPVDLAWHQRSKASSIGRNAP